MNRHMQKLEERIQYLEEVNRLTWHALEAATSLRDFHTNISDLQDTSGILQL